MYGTGITTCDRNGVEVFPSTARSFRSRHDEQQVEESPFLKNQAKSLTAPAYHIEDEPSIPVVGQLHCRQLVVTNKRHKKKSRPQCALSAGTIYS